MIGKLKKYCKLLKFQRKWRKTNFHNKTHAVNIFDANKVIVDDYTYGPLNVKTWNNPNESLQIAKFCSIAGGVTFILGGNHLTEQFSNFSFEHFRVLKKLNLKQMVQ